MKSLLIVIPFILAMGIFLVTRIGTSEIVSPVSVDVQEKIAYYADFWGLEKALVKAIAKKESNFNPKAKNPLDPSYGLMQITPGLVYDYGGIIRDWKNPSPSEIEMLMDIDNNLTVACWFLNHLGKYGFEQQIMSYNLGERGYKEGQRNFPYFDKVRGYYEKYL